MTIIRNILNYAMRQDAPFRKKDVLDFVGSNMPDVSQASVNAQFQKLVSDKRLTRISRGVYEYPEGALGEYFYDINDGLRSWGMTIQHQFPYVDFCVWQPSALAQFMQHVPSSEMILVDVEKEAMESVFWFVQGIDSNVPVLLSPSKQDCERYITHRKQIIVRQLLREAPVDISDICPVPTLEKMLVDAVKDNELQFLQGTELYTIYWNAFSAYKVNRSRLLRYAARRNRKELVEQILQSIGL